MDEKEQLYSARKDVMQRIIDACAQRTNLDEQGVKADIAEELGVEYHRVYYVMDNWMNLIEWRRNQMTDPLDPESVKAAYEDETLAAMAEAGVMADGAGDVMVSIDMSLDEAFRAIKLLPGDMGMNVFTQVLTEADELPKEELLRILQS